MSVMDAALDTIFASVLAIDVTYAPLVGPSVPARAVMIAPDLETAIGHGKIQQESTVFEIRASEVAAPVRGDNIVLADMTRFRVMSGQKKDPRRAVWTIEAAAV